MSSRHHINRSDGIEDEEQPLLHGQSLGQEHDRRVLNTMEDLMTGINDSERETQPLLDEYKVEPSPSGFSLFTNIPARYSIAIWAFFGFFCLYAMRVNLSVAIVAIDMVS